MKPIKQIGAVVLAAGQSTRFCSADSKLVHTLGGLPLIQWPLRAVRTAGAEPVVVVVSPGARAVKAACGRRVRFAEQAEARGTGDAVAAALPVLKGYRGDLLLLSGDLPFLSGETLRTLIARHRENRAVVTLATAILGDPSGWGRIMRRRGQVTAIVEEPDAGTSRLKSNEVNVGVYCVRASFLRQVLKTLRPDNAQKEIYLTDLVARATASGLHVADLGVEEDEVGQVNTRSDLARMEKLLRLRVNRRWMTAGVTLEDPDTAYIGPDVTIGRDTVIGPNVHLRGKTALGERCRLDGSAFVADSSLGNGVHVKFSVVAAKAKIGSDCQIGPFANLRPGTSLAEGVHIGDFVETKKAVIGPRSKANHLAYLGDVEIGSETNIGAGTITCNYDGFRKYPTTIGDRVQIGSDSQLVAPVTVADDAYVGTGTTVRHDVPPGALAFNSKDEHTRPGWVAARRAREARRAAEEKESRARARAARRKRRGRT